MAANPCYGIDPIQAKLNGRPVLVIGFESADQDVADAPPSWAHYLDPSDGRKHRAPSNQFSFSFRESGGLVQVVSNVAVQP